MDDFPTYCRKEEYTYWSLNGFGPKCVPYLEMNDKK